MRSAALLSVLLLFAGLAGCTSDSDDAPQPAGTAQQLPAGLVLDWAPGTISSIHNPSDTIEAGVAVDLPHGWVRVTGDPADPGHLEWPRSNGAVGNGEGGPEQTDEAQADIELQPGETHYFLVPPHHEPPTLVVAGETVQLSVPEVETAPLLRGEHVWNLSAYQEEHFPHRQVNLPGGNYWTSIDYFTGYFEELGLEVEVDPYGTRTFTMDGTVCPPDPELPTDTREPCPGSLANVVATLPGTDPEAPTIFVSGGHFDMVAETTHAAFDDTAGTVATLELARAMSRFEWRHTLKFGLWGGEEDGILGSQFWVKSNPDAASQITTYWNLDVVGMSWPAPLPEPDPIVVAAGPDAKDPEGGPGEAGGPIAEPMLDLAQELQQEWFGYPDEVDGVRMWYYEGVTSGQGASTGTTGDVSQGQTGGYAGVNAVSDHTPFIAAGIPAFFAFNGDALADDMAVRLHTERDTLENMTRYSFFGGEATELIILQEEESGQPYVWDPQEYEAAKETLAQSWEVAMWFPFYVAVVQEVGYWTTPGPAGQEPADAAA